MSAISTDNRKPTTPKMMSRAERRAKAQAEKEQNERERSARNFAENAGFKLPQMLGIFLVALAALLIIIAKACWTIF